MTAIISMLGPTIITMAVKLLQAIFIKNKAKQEDWEFLLKFTDKMRERHLIYAGFQLEIEKQRQAGEDWWAKMEAKK